MSEIRYIDIRPSQASHGGAQLAEGDYDITNAHWGEWDYGGTIPTKVPALAVEFSNGDIKQAQWYSAGKLENMRPTDGGKRLEAVGSATGLNDQSNCFQFLTALVRAGFDEERMLGDISTLIGMRVSLVHEPTQEREIGGQKKKAGTMVVIGKILSDPGAKGAPKGASAAKAAAAAKKPNGGASGDGVAGKATEFVIQILKKAGKTVDKKELSSSLWQAIPGNDGDRGAMMTLAVQDSFLKSLAERGVLYDESNAQLMYVGG
jgi:hypothetical protein